MGLADVTHVWTTVKVTREIFNDIKQSIISMIEYTIKVGTLFYRYLDRVPWGIVPIIFSADERLVQLAMNEAQKQSKQANLFTPSLPTYLPKVWRHLSRK